jgi:thymidylate synthase (FAD)
MNEPRRFDQEDALNWIELIGRTAYKSEDRITDGSSMKFVKGIIKSGHESVLEHMTHKFIIHCGDEILPEFAEIQENTVGFHWSPCSTGYIVSMNVRTLRDAIRFAHNDIADTLFNQVIIRYNTLYQDLGHALLPNYYDIMLVSEKLVWEELPVVEALKHVYRSVRFICDRGVTHEIVRHRPPSYTQESTRYCNYSKKGVTYIEPPWGFDADDVRFLSLIELKYNTKINAGWSPQMARGFLPNCLKTEIVMTATLKQWHHFFELRTPRTAHPQMRELTIPLLSDFKATIGHNFAASIIPEPLEVY